MPLLIKFFGTRAPESAIQNSLCIGLTEKDTKVIVENFTAESPVIYSTPIPGLLPRVAACYLIFTADADVPVELQHQMARRIHAHTVEIRGGHLAMLSQSEAVTTAVKNFMQHVL